MKIYAREHDSGDCPRMRIWAEGWASDQFKIVTWDKYVAFRDLLKTLFQQDVLVLSLHDMYEPEDSLG